MGMGGLARGLAVGLTDQDIAQNQGQIAGEAAAHARQMALQQFASEANLQSAQADEARGRGEYWAGANPTKLQMNQNTVDERTQAAQLSYQKGIQIAAKNAEARGQAAQYALMGKMYGADSAAGASEYGADQRTKAAQAKIVAQGTGGESGAAIQAKLKLMNEAADATREKYPTEQALADAEKADPTGKLTSDLDAQMLVGGRPVTLRTAYQARLMGQNTSDLSGRVRMYGAIPDPTKVNADFGTLSGRGIPGSTAAGGAAPMAPSAPGAAVAPRAPLAPAPGSAGPLPPSQRVTPYGPITGGAGGRPAPTPGAGGGAAPKLGTVPDVDAYQQLKAMGMTDQDIAAKYTVPAAVLQNLVPGAQAPAPSGP